MPQYLSATLRLESFLASQGFLGDRASELLNEVGLSASASWLPSRLTPTGGPLEFSFAEEHGELRYTVEYGPPRVNAGGRFADICRFLAQRGVELPAGDLLDRVTALQSLGSLSYGAWLRVRHDRAGDRFKIYAEVPAAASALAEDWVAGVLGTPLRLPGPAARVEMLGLYAGSDKVEVYYAQVDMLRSGVAIALDPIGLSDASDTLLAAIDEMTPISKGARLPARDVGFSYAFAQSQPEAVFTLYLVAQKVFGDDQNCARWIAGRLPGHDDLMGVLPRTSPGVTHHGMIGLTIGPGGGRPLLSAGVAAPWG
jgi:hypothetical protein